MKRKNIIEDMLDWSEEHWRFVYIVGIIIVCIVNH